MSSSKKGKRARHEELGTAVIDATRENSTMAVFFHSVISEQIGMGPTDEKTMLILSDGPLTAGEIAKHTGLTTASVTSLIDRLEAKGFVRRIRDTQDRRRVIVEAIPERLAELHQVFGSVPPIMEAVIDTYDEEQLTTILNFLTRMNQGARELIATMQQRASDGRRKG